MNSLPWSSAGLAVLAAISQAVASRLFIIGPAFGVANRLPSATAALQLDAQPEAFNLLRWVGRRHPA